MKTRHICICENCNNPILTETAGFIIRGNIYTANPDLSGGLVGNNFKPSPHNSSDPAAVQDVAFCKNCLFKILNLGAVDNRVKLLDEQQYPHIEKLTQ